MEKCEVDFNQCLKRIFWSLPTNVTVGLFNRYLDDNSTDGNEEILKHWIHQNDNTFFEENFSSPINLIEEVQRAGNNYRWTDTYVVKTNYGLRSFNDPCMYIQDIKGEDGAFWEWFNKWIVECLDISLDFD